MCLKCGREYNCLTYAGSPRRNIPACVPSTKWLPSLASDRPTCNPGDRTSPRLPRTPRSAAIPPTGSWSWSRRSTPRRPEKAKPRVPSASRRRAGSALARPARFESRRSVRSSARQGRRDGRRTVEAGAVGPNQPALHRRHPRGRSREQPARRPRRQRPVLRGAVQARLAAHHVPPCAGHERPFPAPDRYRARRTDDGHPA